MVSISTLSKKCISTRRNEAFHKTFVSTSRKNCFRYQVRNKKKWKKIGLHLISRIVSTSREKLRIKEQSLKLIKNPFQWKRRISSQNEGFPEKCNLTGPKSYFHSNQCLKKKENGFFQQKQDPANKLLNNYVMFRHFLVTNKRN